MDGNSKRALHKSAKQNSEKHILIVIVVVIIIIIIITSYYYYYYYLLIYLDRRWLYNRLCAINRTKLKRTPAALQEVAYMNIYEHHIPRYITNKYGTKKLTQKYHSQGELSPTAAST